MKFVWFNKLPSHAAHIRSHVFVIEQEFYDEFDAIDDYAHHVVGYIDDVAVMTGRLFKDDDGYAHIGRIAVEKKYRGNNFGLILLKEIESKAVELGFKRAVLGAQTRASDFYEKSGYIPYGEIFKEEYCEHIMMGKDL